MIEPPAKKTCTKCGQRKLAGAFSKNRRAKDGLQPWCKRCKASHRATPKVRAATASYYSSYLASPKGRAAKDRYIASPEGRASQHRTKARQRALHPQRIAARQAVQRAIRRGDIPPASAHACCCSEQAGEYHHPSYAEDRHLDVVPLCIPCHKTLHRSISPEQA